MCEREGLSYVWGDKRVGEWVEGGGVGGLVLVLMDGWGREGTDGWGGACDWFYEGMDGGGRWIRRCEVGWSIVFFGV